MRTAQLSHLRLLSSSTVRSTAASAAPNRDGILFPDRQGERGVSSARRKRSIIGIGELVVVHEVTVAAAVTNLKRLLAIYGDRKVLPSSPGLRYM